jgi:hypothetical protein
VGTRVVRMIRVRSRSALARVSSRWRRCPRTPANPMPRSNRQWTTTRTIAIRRPRVLDPSVSDYTSVKISWAPSSDAARYRVYVDGQHVASIPGAMDRVTIGGLNPGQTYQLFVTADSAQWGAESPASNTISASSHGL